MDASDRSREPVDDRPGAARSRPAAIPYTASDLPVDDEGRVYHLQVRPEQIAPDILIVGDPGRAEFIGSQFLHDIDFHHEHRGLVTITGLSTMTGDQTTIISPLRTTVATSGIGTPSLEVVINELVALNEIDFETRTRKSRFPRLHVIRVGTSGGLQPSTELGTPIITTYAIGLDNAGIFYEMPFADDSCLRLEREVGQLVVDHMPADSRFYGKIHPYVTRAAPSLVQSLQEAAQRLGVEVKAGLTASLPGFSAAQGRDTVRIRPSILDLDRILADYDPKIAGQRVENMEMESSFLLHFLGGLGYWAGTICPAIANRRRDTIDVNYRDAIENAVRIALLALATARTGSPEVRIG